MKTYYYGINETELNILLEKGFLTLPKDYLKSINSAMLSTTFNQAVLQASKNVYLNKAENIIILTLGFEEEVSEYFYLRRNKQISMKNVLGYYKSDLVTKEYIYSLESSVELALDYNNILNREFIDSLICADEEDVYKHINLTGIELVDINYVMDEKLLNEFIERTFNYIGDISNYQYKKLS